MHKFEADLTRLGLKDKEAAIYLACLELGSSPVQQIARKAKIVRATAYVILEALMKQGLVTKFQEGKKTLFSAGPPLQLMRLVEKEREQIEEKRLMVEAILPSLQALKKDKGNPSVRYYEGREGLHAIRQEMVMYCQPGDTIYNFTPIDYLWSLFPDKVNEEGYQRQRSAKGIHSKTLFSSKSEQVRQQLMSNENKVYSKLAERRVVPADLFPVASGMSVYRDRVAIGSFTGKMSAVIIESQSMADMMRVLFELAWQRADELVKKT